MFYLLIHPSSDTWTVSTFWLSDNTTVNIGMQLSVPGPVCRSGAAGSHDTCVLRFLRKTVSDSGRAVLPFYVPVSAVRGLRFLLFVSSKLFFFFLFKNYHSHSSECEVVSPLHIFLGEMYNQIFCPFLNWVPCVYWVIGVFIYSGFYGFSYYIKKSHYLFN